MSIVENIQEVREKIAAAARAAGRSPEEITLVGASKMNGADACVQAIAAGIDALGENRVQELLEKYEQHAYDGAPLHFIGHLQRNKVRQIVGKVSLIQSAGSLELLEEIEKQAAKQSLVQDILLEVNIGGEESKSGFAPDALFAGAEAALEKPHLRVLGLMTIPPVETHPGENMRYFEKVQGLYVDMDKKMFHNGFQYLSMGMSGDYEEAIAAGATMVRIGTAIFGARNYTT